LSKESHSPEITSRFDSKRSRLLFAAIPPVVVSLALSLLPQPLLAAAAGSVGEADEYLIKNKFKEAEEAYRGLLDQDEDGDAYAGLAVSLAKQGWPSKISEAEKILRQAREKFSDNPNVIAAAGYVSFIHSKTVASPAKRDLFLEASEQLCKRAIKANPDILIAQQTLGLVKMAQDDTESAVDPLRKANEIAENALNLTTLAQALLKVSPKDTKEPEELLTKALALKTDYWPARLQKAIVMANQGKAEEAFTELHNIPETERSAEWYQTEGDIYRKQGDGPAALASWHESIRRDPHIPDTYSHLAEYYAIRGDGELAINEMHNQLEILPNDMNAHSKLAELALRQDKLEVAESEYRIILDSQPDDPAALLGLSRVYFRKARKEGQYPPGYQKLMEQLQNVVTEQSVRGQMVKQGTKNLQENIQLSEAEKSLTEKHFRDAREKFSQVITTHKEDPYDLLTLGEQAYNDGDLRSAEQAFTYAKDIPEVASRADSGITKISGQRNEAARQTKLGDATQKIPEVAIDHYKQALIADPQYPPAYYGLHVLYMRGEKPEPQEAIDSGICFLEAADDANPLRREVESNLQRLKKRVTPGGKTK